jgi:excisionase family DNA binding protein
LQIQAVLNNISGMKETRTTLTVQEVAEMKGVDTRTVRGWIQRGLIDAEQINPRLWLVSANSVKNFQPPTAGRPRKPAQQQPAKKGRKS